MTYLNLPYISPISPLYLPHISQALRDRSKPLSTHYGAIVGLQLL